MFQKIKYKLALTVLAVAIVAVIPLSFYILAKQEKEKIDSTISIGRGNTKLLGKTMLDVFLKSGGEPESMRIDAEEAINTYRDQFELGLVYGQTLMLTKKHRGLIMATLDKNTEPLDAGAIPAASPEKAVPKNGSTIKKGKTQRNEGEINEYLKYTEKHLGVCFNDTSEKCYNFTYVAEYKGTPVILSAMSVSEKHVLAPIHRLRLLIYASAGVALIFALILGIGVSRFITGPIAALVDGVRRYSRGDFEHKVDIKVHDELKTLGTAFNDMAGEIATKIREIEDHRDNLEVKVQERTSELRTALVEVSRLKEQQDADYYLTTFLFKPLCINRNSSKFIKTEFFLKQKKEFSFRNKRGEIGGDICITDNILFREPNGETHRYLFATNADAMGKSIQGAGGAIVYGTAINTILATSTAGERVLESTPREWLMRMYKELHNIFLSFDGSMLVSGVFLLLNEHTGKAYYMNAEHPWAISYRDNKAEFIENDLMLRKLGADIPDHPLTVKEFTFSPGDVLIFASDGRDDIILQEARDGENRVINEDENAILRVIQKSEGDIEKAVEALQTLGGLSDDLSMVRIEVLGFNPAPVKKKAVKHGEPTVQERLLTVQAAIKQGNFKIAAERLQSTSFELEVENVPQYYILLSRIQLNDGQLRLAKESLEKAVELGHTVAPTYRALGKIFYRLNMKEEALAAWKKALELKPEDKATETVVHKLQEQFGGGV